MRAVVVVYLDIRNNVKRVAVVFLDITMSGFCGRRSGVVVVFLHGTFCGELRCYSMTFLYICTV